jgi:hypothetical protein
MKLSASQVDRNRSWKIQPKTTNEQKWQRFFKLMTVYRLEISKVRQKQYAIIAGFIGGNNHAMSLQQHKKIASHIMDII